MKSFRVQLDRATEGQGGREYPTSLIIRAQKYSIGDDFVEFLVTSPKGWERVAVVRNMAILSIERLEEVLTEEAE